MTGIIMIEGHISLMDRANMNQFIGHRSQIEFFVLYDPHVYHVVY